MNENESQRSIDHCGGDGMCVCLCVPHVAVEPMLSVISPTALTSASVPEGLTTSVSH